MNKASRIILFLCVVFLPPTITIAEATNFTPSTAAAYLKLTPPVITERAGMYMDGGSIGVTLVDANTNKFHMFEDYSARSSFAAMKQKPEGMSKDHWEIYKKEKNTRGRIYIGDKKPSRKGRLTTKEEGKRVKAAVICLSLDWVKQTSPEKIDHFRSLREFRSKDKGMSFNDKMQDASRWTILRLWGNKSSVSSASSVGKISPQPPISEREE